MNVYGTSNMTNKMDMTAKTASKDINNVNVCELMFLSIHATAVILNLLFHCLFFDSKNHVMNTSSTHGLPSMTLS